MAVALALVADKMDLTGAEAQNRTNFVFVPSLSDLVLRATAVWRLRHGNCEPKGALSFDINGFITTLGDHHYDTRIIRAIEEADQCGFMIIVSTANDYDSAVEYINHIGIDPNIVSLWNCGNGKGVYTIEGGRVLCHTVVPLAMRREHAEMMDNIFLDIMGLCEAEGIEFSFIHPTQTRAVRPNNGRNLMAMAEYRSDPCVNITFRMWDPLNQVYQPAPDGLVQRIGSKILTDILPRHGFHPKEDGVEINPERNFIYIIGFTTMRDTRKAEYLIAINRILKDEFGENFHVTHAGDNHNEFGCEAATDRLWVPADADRRLTGYLEAEQLPYDWHLQCACPAAAVEFIHRTLLEQTGEGLPADLWP